MTRPNPRKLRYLQILGEAHDQWTRENTAVRFAPDEHPADSDYNLNVLDMEATPEQLDELDKMIAERLEAEGLTDWASHTTVSPDE